MTNKDLEEKVSEQKTQIGELQTQISEMPDIEAIKEQLTQEYDIAINLSKERVGDLEGRLEKAVEAIALSEQFAEERGKQIQKLTDALPSLPAELSKDRNIFDYAVEQLQLGLEAQNQLAMVGSFNVSIHEPMLMISLALHDVAHSFDASYSANQDTALPEAGEFHEAAAERFGIRHDLMSEFVKLNNFGEACQWLYQQLYNAIGPPPPEINTDVAEMTPPLPMTNETPAQVAAPRIPGVDSPMTATQMMRQRQAGQGVGAPGAPANPQQPIIVPPAATPSPAATIPAAPSPMMSPNPGAGIAPPPVTPTMTPIQQPSAIAPAKISNPAFMDPAIGEAIVYFTGYSAVHSQTLRAFITNQPEVIGGMGDARIPTVEEVRTSINWCYANEVGTKPNATKLMTLLSYMTQGQ